MHDRYRGAAGLVILAVAVLLVVPPFGQLVGPRVPPPPEETPAMAGGVGPSRTVSVAGPASLAVQAPANMTLLAVGTNFTFPSFVPRVINFTLSLAASFRGSWNSTAEVASYLLPSYREVYWGVVCRTNWTFNMTLLPANYSLVFLPCGYAPPDPVVTVTSTIGLTFDQSTLELQPPATRTVPAHGYLSWNFSLAQNESDLVFDDWGSISTAYSFGLLTEAQYATFESDPAQFDFGTAEGGVSESSGEAGDWIAGVCYNATAGNWTMVVFDSTGSPAVANFSIPFFVAWPGPATPVLTSLAVAPEQVSLFVADTVALAATTVTSFGTTNPEGAAFTWSVLPASLGFLTDPAGPNITFVASAPGQGTIEISASWDGTSVDAAVSVRVAIAPSFTAVAISNRSSGAAPFAVGLSARVSNATGAVAFLWTFGDGTPPAASPSPNHTYAAPGVYLVGLSAEDAAGHVATSYLEITATSVPPAPAPLIVRLTVTLGSNRSGAPVEFVASATGGVPPYSWAWSGLPATCPSSNTSSASCILPSYGTLVVAVVVTDQAGHAAAAIGTASAAPALLSPPPVVSVGPVVPSWVEPAVGAAIVVSLVSLLAAIGGILLRRRGGPPQSEDQPYD